MKTIELNGTWQMTGGGYHVSATVPGSVVSALLENHLIPDPYYGANEAAVQHIFDHDYTFARGFSLTEEELACRSIFLRCDGLDTVCRIEINGKEVASTDNMHWQHRFDVRHVLKAGENTISLTFRSPVEYSKTLNSPLGKTFVSMRKAHCMFGWDWGIRLPDSGIWRDIALELVDDGRLTDLYVRQQHKQGKVALDIQACAELFREGIQLELTVTGPDGAILHEGLVVASEKISQKTEIFQPRLWWPAGYGKQPLYRVTARLVRAGQVLDERSVSLGLRTVSLYRGEKNEGDYQFSVNGLPIYIKGANIIIDDAIISRTTKEKWERMIDNAVRANYNTLRVWGGAYYPPDLFFDLCDRRGIMVYQDFMFACRFYWPSKEFLDSIKVEVAQTVIRLRNHPCLCQWCGNNEADFFYTAFTSMDKETEAVRRMFNKKRYDLSDRTMVRWLYTKTFLKVIPQIVKNLSPEVGYVHSSPSVGDKLGVSDMFEYFPKGDAHYYHHVNDDAPYQKLEQFKIRMLSEFGFQSYPSLKTLREYLPAEALEPYSEEMLVHQKFNGGNQVIELYLSRDFFVPKRFEQYVYMSQMMAGEILRYTAEYMRRERDYSRGLLIWQHNDCWPVVSWAGVDYCGRWKGQQYYMKRFFAPVLVSAKVDEGQTGLYVVNDRPHSVEGQLQWALYDGRKVVSSGVKDITLPAADSSVYVTLDTPGNDVKHNYALCYTFRRDEEVLAHGSKLFVEQKDYAFERADIHVDVRRMADGYRLKLVSPCYVKALCLDLTEGDAIFSDNFFDLEPGVPYVVTVRDRDLKGVSDLDGLKSQLTMLCVNDVAFSEKL